MISDLLHYLDHMDIIISLNNEKLRLKYKKENINQKIKEQIKNYKPLIIKRIKENEQAIEKGFMVYSHGDLYEYRYGYNSFLFIERMDNYKAIAWRANYRQDDTKPYKVKTIANSTFSEAFQQSSSFIDWLNKKNGRRYIS